MASMTMLPQSRPLTYADLGRVRERSAGDGHRYELIDGSLLVTPSPSRRHQRCVVGLTVLLHSHCPEHLEVLVAPFDVVLAEDTAVQPDLLVTRRPGGDRPGGEGGDEVPLLVVEVLSPSTRLVDLNLKKARYAQAGCPSYWVVDPDVPSVTVWQLRGTEYVEVVTVARDDAVGVEHPYRVTLSPGPLVAP